MTPAEMKDAASLAQALYASQRASERLSVHAAYKLWIGIWLLALGTVGIFFRSWVHEDLPFILGTLILAGGFSLLGWRDDRAQRSKQDIRAAKLYVIAREKDYPVDYEGRYSDPAFQPDTWHASPYARL